MSDSISVAGKTFPGKPCVICEMPTTQAFEGSNQPMGGTAFTSGGHYGSMFDPDNGDFLELNICNSCLISIRAKRFVLMGTRHRPTRVEITYSDWTEGSRS